MRFTIKHNNTVVAEVDIDRHEDWLTVDINDQPAIGFDLFYSDGTNTDINDDDTHKVIVGCWTEPEAEEWRRLAYFLLPAGPATPVDPI